MLVSEPPVVYGDIAATNLRAARALPGAEGIDERACLRTLDAWASRVAGETNRLAYFFHCNPRAYENSFSRFRMEALVTVLQRDLGVHYRQQLIDMADREFFRRSEHLFIHGVLAGVGGTCCSLPPVFAAVGRRLSYPLRLVQTFQHAFVRWDEPCGERFNVECTSRGFLSSPDEYYLTWPRALTAHQARRYGVLRSLTEDEEAGAFLSQRGLCLQENGRLEEAAKAAAFAAELDSGNEAHLCQLREAMRLWDAHQRPRIMPGFPPFRVVPSPQYARIPREAVCDLAYLKARQLALDDPEAEKNWWAPMRRDQTLRPPRVPAFVTVVFPDRPGGEITLAYHEKVPADFHGGSVLPY